MLNPRLENVQSVTSVRTIVYLLLLLTCFVLIVPSEWERLQFFLLLLYPIILSYKHFQLDYQIMKKSLFFIFVFIVASLATFLIHVLQLIWEISNQNGLFGWKLYINPLLNAIPYNDGMWLRQFSTPVMDRFFVYIYIHGFVFCLLALCIYYMLTAQPKKILLAMFAGHFLQYLLILPFHFWVDGHQVWWIQNLWYGTTFTDPIEGYRTTTDPIIPSLNHVFPSMHTSIAFVTIMLVLREKSKPLKYSFTLLNVGIIFSTVYLGIHWVIDIFGGILFGYLVLKLADKIMATDWKNHWSKWRNKVSNFFYPANDIRQYQQKYPFLWRDDK